jgi:hypothetical protein
MVLREIEWDDMDWIKLAQDRDQWRALVKNLPNASGHTMALGSAASNRNEYHESSWGWKEASWRMAHNLITISEPTV